MILSRTSLVLPAVGLLLLAACGGSDSSETAATSAGGGAGTGGGSAGTSAGAGTGGSAGGAAGKGGAGAGGSAGTGGVAGAAGSAGTGGSAGTAGKGGSAGSGGSAGAGGGSSQCGGIAGLACPDGFYCDFADNLCGGNDNLGTCVKKPGGCPPGSSIGQVCGCDGKLYVNACDAGNAGVDTSLTGSCQAPANTVKCGDHFCPSGQAYCENATSDVGGVANTYTCVLLPPACQGTTPTCGCVANEPCGALCTDAGNGNLTLVCPGG
jgi:hypothetical protein